MAYIYSLADTWNASGTTFTGIGLNVTDSASAAGSLLMDLQVAGVSRFSVTKAGRLTVADTTQFASPSIAFPSNISFSAIGTNLYAHNASFSAVRFSTNAPTPFVSVNGSGYFGFASGDPSSADPDTRLFRDAANTLAQRNGVNAQAFNLYNTYTDVSNYSRLVMYADGSANYYIGTQKAGTGASASLFVGTGAGSGVAGNGQLTLAGSSIGITTQAGNVFNITAGGAMSWNTDNAFDIGLSTGNRPRSVYVATSVTPGRGVAVASLPTPSAGMMARVTDATTPTVGSTVTGGGASAALCWYNGTNWTVIGV